MIALWLAACAHHAPAAPAAPSAVDRCLEVLETTLRNPQDASYSQAAAVAVGCADLYAEPACRDAFLAAPETPPERMAVTTFRACAGAYCPTLDPRPEACSVPEDASPTQVAAAWAELRDAIWRRDLTPAELDRLSAPIPRRLTR